MTRRSSSAHQHQEATEQMDARAGGGYISHRDERLLQAQAAAAAALHEPVVGGQTAAANPVANMLDSLTPAAMKEYIIGGGPERMGEFGAWTTNALILALIAAVLVEFDQVNSKKISSKRIVAIICASLGMAIIVWSMGVYFKLKQPLANWAMGLIMLGMLAVLAYLIVIAA